MEAAAAGIDDAGSQFALRAVSQWYNVYGYRALVRLAEAFVLGQRELRSGIQQRIAQGVTAPADLAQIDSSGFQFSGRFL